MLGLGNTRPLPGHSSIGSINTLKKLHPGVPPPTTESNKGGSVPVIWQNQARRLPEVHPEHSATASGRGSNGRVQELRRSHMEMDPSCQQGTVQSSSGSVMAWTRNGLTYGVAKEWKVFLQGTDWLFWSN
ncbi:hypothetical protein TNCV_4639531 [Trichonephila clavipes]|nr:hypothetical protein TNCV_4639531 [Trichonephila clavipes]